MTELSTVKPGVEFLEKFLRHGAVSLQPEDDHAEVSTGRDLKPRVRPHQGLKLASQADIFSDHVLEPRDPVVPQYKPELESSEPLTQGNLPVLGNNKMPELYYQPGGSEPQNRGTCCVCVCWKDNC